MKKITTLLDTVSKHFNKHPKIEKYNRVLYSVLRLFLLVLLTIIVMGWIEQATISIIHVTREELILQNTPLLFAVSML